MTASGDSNGKMPSWAIMALIGALSVGGSFLTTLLNANNPIKTIDDMRGDIKEIRSDMRASYLSKAEHGEFLRRTDEHIVRLDRRIDKIIDDLVPRPELEARSASTTQVLADINKQLDDIRKLVGTDYTLRDKILELQARIDFLNNRLLPVAPRVVPP